MKINLYLKLAVIMLSAAALSACNKPTYPPGGENSAVLEGSRELEGDREGSFATISITSRETWTIEIAGIPPASGGEAWITPSLASGWGNASVILSCTANGGAARKAAVVVKFGSSSEMFEISQKEAGSTASFNGNTDIRFDEIYDGAFISISSEEGWGITIREEGSQTPAGWISASPPSGSGDAEVRITNTMNYGLTARAAVITVTFPSAEKSFTVRQSAAIEVPPTIPGWTELPEFDEDGGLFFIAHYATLDGKRVRNYSSGYDPQVYGSHWVAYPMHESYTGSEDRSDEWAYDPEIPSSLQFRYHPNGFGAHNFDRGHHIPSSDRTATELLNEQTFFSTNITPQQWELNQFKWKQLEDWFQDQLNGRDTVWMVTGAYYREPLSWITNDYNPDKEVAKPTSYYKVAVKKKKNSDSYTGIGFWQDNVSTGRSNPRVSFSEAKTIRWIEEQTGTNFFVNIPVGSLDEGSVEQEEWKWNR